MRLLLLIVLSMSLIKPCANELEKLQITLSNTTSADQQINLFERGITTIPQNTVVSAQAMLQVGSKSTIYNTTDGDWYAIAGEDIVRISSSSRSVIATSVSLPTLIANITYNPDKNLIYAAITATDTVYVFDCSSFSFVTSFSTGAGTKPTDVEYSTFNQRLYVSQGSGDVKEYFTTAVLPTFNRTFSTTTGVFGSVINESTNELYVDNFSSFDVFSLTTGLLITNVATASRGMVYHATLGEVWGVSGSGILFINPSTYATSTFTPSTAVGGLIYNPNDASVYFATSNPLALYQSLDANKTLNFSFTGSFGDANTPFDHKTALNPTTNELMFGCSTGRYVFVDLLSTILITGTTDYEYLRQAIEFDPIKAEKICFYADSQEQLTELVNVNSFDANGQEYEYFESPVLQVDKYQEQGQQSCVVFKNLVFDGFTILKNYAVRANEQVVLVLYYRQQKRVCFLEDQSWFAPRKPLGDQYVKEMETLRAENDVFVKMVQELSEDNKIFQLDITNITAIPVLFDLFAPADTSNPTNNPSLTFGNEDDYNFFMQGIRSEPARIYGMQVVSSNTEQLNQGLNWARLDATGEDVGFVMFPVNDISAYQQDAGRALFKLKHMVIDGIEQSPNYSILPFTTITLVLYYNQWKRASIFKNGKFEFGKQLLVKNNKQLTNSKLVTNEQL